MNRDETTVSPATTPRPEPRRNGWDHAAEQAGRLVGWAWSPWFAAAGALRGARALHPRGDVYVATVQPCAGPGHALGERLAGRALVRCSGALWKRTVAWPEVLGVALRFRGVRAPSAEAHPRDQDLLFATVRHPWLVGVAPLLTDASDYLDARYFAVSPFDVPDLGRVTFRVDPLACSYASGTRSAKLAEAVRHGGARFVLSACVAGTHEWLAVATIQLDARAAVDGEALRFSAFRNGLELFPRGFVHALRKGAYAASRWGSTTPMPRRA